MHLDLGPDWVAEVAGDKPAWRHLSGVVFRLVPGGVFQMGLSDAEVATLRTIAERRDPAGGLAAELQYIDVMRPARAVTVEPFLMARHPLTVSQVRYWLPEYEDDYAQTSTAVARLDAHLDDLLTRLPFRLPTEAEWEYAARAGTTTLTYRGDLVPSEGDLLDDFGAEERILASENAFGLAAMGSAFELCADVYANDYVGAPSNGGARAGEGVRTVRGGAADMSPWQGCNEWLAMLSASRGPQDMFAAVRPVVELPTQPA